MMRILTNIMDAHRETYILIKRSNNQAQIGIAKNFIIFRPSRKWNLLDIALTKIVHAFYNQMIPDAFKTKRLKIFFPLFYDL
jgi:beta-glucosidase/6-phospho-beta-glucosidase/beta-galactosidase